MATECSIRRAGPRDARAVSALVIRVLHISNTPDYGPENVARIAANFTPETVLDDLRRNYMLVAELGGRIVGTASLGGTVLAPTRQAVRTFFVDAELQGTGIGTKLLAAIEAEARRMGLPRLHVQSSIAGEPFYAARGFAVVAEHWEDDERTLQMVKPLA
jgi:GNAT superfamily N-acetyltransferase